MTKDELIVAVAESSGETKAAVGRVLDALAGEVTVALAVGQQVDVPGLVRLKRVAKPARTGRNPRTGETIQIAARNAVTAKPVAALARAVN
jgi:DNA-binding protein HU-beta